MIFVAGMMLFTASPAYSLPADHYAASSVLAEGRWARVKVSATGMHLITDAELRKLGFTDPSKVRVYGRGGRQNAEVLNATNPDDLPQQPSVRTARGIVFFATDEITWTPSKGDTPYTHSVHPYSHDNYYFLSDRDATDREPEKAAVSKGGSSEVTDFSARLLHEQELEFGGESGCQIFGEDFRSKTSQTFDFRRTDASAPATMVNIRFGAKTTNGRSSLTFKANGTSLSSTSNDQISSSSISDYFQTAETSKTFDCGDESLNLSVNYSYTGTLFMARLDYIEMFYRRKLALRDGELYFYGTFIPSETLCVSGCSASTRIWDVTDPASPKEVDFTLSGSTARFGVPYSGYREFVAFDAESISRTATSAGNVANQDIHALPTPDMVIITLPEYRQGAEQIARLHEETDGFRVHVIDADKIYNEFSGGKADVGAFRSMLKMWYDRGSDGEGHKLGYCLLMGRPFYDNKLVSAAGRNLSYTPLPIYQSYTGKDEHTSYSTDDFIAKLSDNSGTELRLASEPLSIAVGRIPVTTSAQALDMARKIEKYVKQPDYGAWRNKVMIIADDEDNNVHFEQAQAVYRNMGTGAQGDRRVYDRVYLDSYRRVLTGLGPTYPQATERMLRNYNDGVAITNYIGHGSPVGWGHENLWTWDQINSLNNSRLTFIISATCRFSPWDEPIDTGGEILLMKPDAGCIGLISTARTVYVDGNGSLNASFAREMFKADTDNSPRRFGDVYKDGKNGYLMSNTLRFIFMGDPALRIPGGSRRVTVTSINGKDVTDPSMEATELPTLPALSSTAIAGCVMMPDGSTDTDFNGTVVIDLYDAERVITTFGNGSSGKSVNYNDRDKRLSSVTAKVTAGEWSAVLRVPPEIQGNYTRALIAAYASDETGKEAAGTCDNLYVYGYNDDADSDTEAPVIDEFYVNSPNFTNGGVVNSSPVLFARISDESGVNISDSGIGHAMTLTVDDSSVIGGLSSYFTQDADDPTTGHLVFPISNLSSGAHKLTLTVWDNANNVSKASLDVNVGVALDPVIYDITASVTPAQVDFHINLDRPNTALECEIGIFDLNGRRIWEDENTYHSGIDSRITSTWDLTDTAGNRVPRGIYVYRVKVLTPEGTYSTKSKKIAVAAAQ